MTGVAALSGYYDFRLVSLSVLIAVLAAYAALDLGGRVTTARGWVRPAWLCCGAIAMGFGIWAMHFVGMEAFRLPVPVLYDWPSVLVSLVLAILTSGVALLAVSQPRLSPTRLTIGAIFMGGGIAAMHYVGMEAMRLPAMCRYSPWLVGLSVLLAAAISFATIKLTFSFRESTAAWSVSKTLIAVLLGLAILVMHYVGMAAARFLPLAGMNGSLAHAVQVSALGLTCVALSAGVALGLVFLTSIVDRHFWLQAEQLAKSQSQLQTIFDNMTEGIVVVGSKQDAVLVNPAAVRLLGLPKGKYEIARIVEEVEVLSMDGTLLPPEQWPTARALGGEFAQNREALVRRKSTGETSVLEVTTAPVRTGSGELEQVVITYRDIAARRRMDEAQQRLARQLAESQMQLQAIFDTMTEGIYVLDRNGDTVVANAAAIRLLAVPGDKSAFRNFIEQNEILSPDGVPLAYEELPAVRALRGEFVQNFEVLCRQRSTGKVDAREISTAPVGNGFEESGQVVVTFRDVTERKQMDEMRNRLAAIVESSEDAIIGIDDRGLVTSWNRGADKVFGYTAEEMLGNSVLRLLPEDRSHEEAEFIRRIKAGETVEQIETVRKGKNGVPIQVSLTISPIRDANGKVVGASKIARNITERKQLQNQLYQSQKMEAIGQLTGGIAHDFNNLLGVILGNLDMLEIQVDDNEAALKRIRTAQTAATRGADLIRRLLATSSNMEWTAAPSKLQHSVRNMMDLAQTLGRDINIVLHVDDQMPPVLVDAAGLESALLNLAVNARDAMPRGGTLTVTAQLSMLDESYPPVKAGELKAGCYACVSVSDTGHGMSKETLARVFEPFFTTKPRGKGTGLGLAMVYGFAKQSGGTARIYSELGYGTTVSLYLPLAGEISETVTPVGRRLTTEKLRGIALVVDDEAELVEIAKTYLEEMGYTVYYAEDAARALALVEKHREIDLLVTDILMPGMNGTELAKKIRESLNEVKIIYCSGFPANALAERSLSLADGPLLHKPYLRTTFGSVVRAVMHGNGRGRAREGAGAALPASDELGVGVRPVTGTLSVARTGEKDAGLKMPEVKPIGTVLVADDEEANRELLSYILRKDGCEVVLAENGEEAIAVFATRKIDLCLLDVKMPGRNGFQVCRSIKNNPETRLVPVVLVTGLINTNDRIAGIECGADDYLNKPIRREELSARVRSLLRLKHFTDELESAEKVLFSVALSIEAKDPFTEGHCARMSRLSVQLASALGLPEEQRVALHRAGILHDIGKVAVPDQVLLKQGPLTEMERKLMEQHPLVGERLCAPLRSFHAVLPIIRSHHEKLNGSGYPDGLKGEAIPLTARIMTTVDVYDALTHDRPYRLAMTSEEAFDLMRGKALKGQLDWELVEELRRVIARDS